MIINFIVFLIIGLLLAVIIEKEYGIIIAIIIAVVWGFMKVPLWGLIAFIELCVGFGLGLKLRDMTQAKNRTQNDNNDDPQNKSDI